MSRRDTIADAKALAEGVEKLAKLHADPPKDEATTVPLRGAQR